MIKTKIETILAKTDNLLVKEYIQQAYNVGIVEGIRQTRENYKSGEDYVLVSLAKNKQGEIIWRSICSKKKG